VSDPANAAQWDIDHFRFAQSPRAWLLTAESLLNAAPAHFFSALEQAKRHDAASKVAEDKAWAAMEELGQDSAVADIEVMAPEFLPAFLLYGFAIENLLKGLYVLANPNTVDDKEINIPTTHNLTFLAQTVGLKTSETEADMLRRLTSITTWSGRYPVAKTLEAFRKIGINRETIIQEPVEAYAHIGRLAEKLRKMLDGDQRKPHGGAVIVFRDGPDEAT
jgi:hypothetical protein